MDDFKKVTTLDRLSPGGRGLRVPKFAVKVGNADVLVSLATVGET